jgi:CBS domain-containing protein
MKISRLLRGKGDFVATVGPDTSVRDALAALAQHGVGALVVSSDRRAVEGIVSERDVVRRLHDRGTGILDGPVSAIMSTQVRTADPAEEVESLMDLMTTNRIRHVPVVAEGMLVGIVSIGDVVKARVDELVDDRRALHEYISAR